MVFQMEIVMKYTLITSKGSVMQFYVEALANTYKEIHGGVVFSQQSLEVVDNSAIMGYNGTMMNEELNND
jgi:hypothetical protein